MRLQGKTAIVTGAAGGIGRASCQAFAREGAHVVAADLRGEDATRVAQEIGESGGSAGAAEVDVTNADSVARLVRETTKEHGRLDVMFNNAGIFPDADGSVTDTDESVWEQVVNVNLRGVFLGCKYAVPAMIESGGGSLINTASFVAVMGAATSQSAYTASKGGVLALTREIAVEYARAGIRANALCPGPTNTPLLAGLLADPQRRARRIVHIPMGRLAEVEEIANAALFLASDESSFITGTQFLVDGGITAAYVTPE